MKFVMSTLVAVGFALQAFAEPATVTAKWRYQPADALRHQTGSETVSVPTVGEDRRAATDPVVFKTVYLVQVAGALKARMDEFHKTCQPTPRPSDGLRHHGAVRPGPVPPRRPPVVDEECVKARQQVGDKLAEDMTRLQSQLLQTRFSGDRGVAELLDLGQKLARNMKEARRPVYPVDQDGLRIASPAGFSGAASGLNVTSGGAMDIGFFRKVVADGGIPVAENLAVEGLLKEFDLSFSGRACDQLLCVNPAVAVDEAADKLYVQIAMNSNVDEASFRRKPLNLSIVLDISGSMSATDDTNQNRLEWAKDAIVQAVKLLNEQDMLSIVIFDTNSETLIEPTRVGDKAAILEKVEALQTRGSTNLEAGLRDGYEHVSAHVSELDGYEHRVILVTDANLNTGVTGQSDLLKLVTDYATEGIGLTAIGVGENFNQEFIDAITKSRGGNYIFVQSGAELAKYFGVLPQADGSVELDPVRFHFLVTPVAYNFRAELEVSGIEAELVNAYGVPAAKGAGVRELVNLQTLFFSKEGGAILLEYDLK